MSETKFYNLSPLDRLEVVARETQLNPAEITALSNINGLDLDQADHMIENVVGLQALPVGMARNFIINGKEVSVPMMVEEPSVVAGASFMAKLAQAGGGFIAEADDPVMIGQMQVLDLKDEQSARAAIEAHRQELAEAARTVDPTLEKLGGGFRDIEVRWIAESPIGPFMVLHVLFDVRDAMGANAINSAVERLAPMVERITGGRVLLKIISNLADRRLARARVTIPLEALAFEDFSAESVRDGIIEAWAFAAADPYRAATHNKGIMNGVDAVVLATGNDWRAVEAGAHAYAARSGKYTSLSTWGKDAQGNLTGSLEMPMAVGIIGGATRVHPTAKVNLKIMGVASAADLAKIIVSVGLAQNLAALRALASEGIQRGHMGLHARQIAMSAGATVDQVEPIARRMVEEKNIRFERAVELLKEMK